MSNERSVQSLLTLPDHPMGHAIQRADLLRMCNQSFQEILAKPLINKVNIINIQTRTVVIGVASASLMTQLRFESEEILNKIKQLPGLQLAEAIQFKVIPPASNQNLHSGNSTQSSQQQPGKNSARRPISSYASQVLREAAQGASDPELQEALLRLSKNDH